MTMGGIDPIGELRDALTKLRPTGPTGFEGLVALTLGALTGIPFRLASSGLQAGVDADSTYPNDHVSFECKRYSGEISRESVLSKLSELSLRHDVDVWVLGATTTVSAQLAGQIRAIGEEQALETLVLDWGESYALPPLGVACAALSDTHLETFLTETDLDASHQRAIKEGITWIRQDSRFDNHLDRLRDAAQSAQVGVETMRRANIAWMEDVLADRAEARRALGQPLAPSAAAAGTCIARTSVLKPIQLHLTGDSTGTTFYVLGNEGVGKSWAVMQAWQSLARKPALFFLSADARIAQDASDGALALLAKTIARQVGAPNTIESSSRWKRRLERWLKLDRALPVRFIVFLDGINQQPNIDWARLIESLTSIVEGAGGRLVVSSRKGYFEAHVANRLSDCSPAGMIRVDEWTSEERDQILCTRGIKADSLAAPVLRSLRNPRILALALELLDNDTIRALNELNVGRLLFEHIRASDRDSPVPLPAHHFVERLRGHARELLNRVSDKTADDSLIFRSLDAVIEGYFFHPVDNDPTRYSLSSEGLRLALALAVLDHLQTAHRNGRPLLPEVSALIDPVSSLDDVGGVLLAALSVRLADKNVSPAVCCPLLVAFCELQNVDTNELSAFVALATNHPDPFMDTARHLSLESEDRPGGGWVRFALMQARMRPSAWAAMLPHLHRWMRVHSLRAERAVPRGLTHDDTEQAQRIEQAATKLSASLKSLSDTERSFVRGFEDVEGDTASLHAFAFTLLWGRPLSGLADSIAALVLGRILDPNPLTDNEDLRWLVWSNVIDWNELRADLLPWIDKLSSSDASRSGKWAAACLLGLTGAPEDAARAKGLEADLRSDDLRSWSWRLKETWCDSDPCDPESPHPTNMAGTIRRFRELSVDKLWRLGGMGEEDHFFDGAMAAMARFAPETAVERIRVFAEDVLRRSGLPLRQGIIASDTHRAALTPDLARAFLRLRSEHLHGKLQGFEDQECNFVSTECLSIAFPHVSGNEQLAALTVDAIDQNLFLNLNSTYKAAAPDRIESQLQRAVRIGNERVQCHLLSYLHGSSIELTEQLSDHALELCNSESEKVRIHALSLLGSKGRASQLRRFAATTWSATNCTPGPEARFGSRALLQAVHRADVPILDIIKRVDSELIGQVALLGPEGAKVCTTLLDDAIAHAVRSPLSSPTVSIEAHHDHAASNKGAAIWLQDPHRRVEADLALLRSHADDIAHHYEQQQNRFRAFDDFRAQLAVNKVLLIVNPLTVREFTAIAAHSSHRVGDWKQALLQADALSKPLLCNLAFVLAAYLTESKPEEAIVVLDAYRDVESFVHFTSGFSHTSILQHVIWSAPPSGDFIALRRERLDAAENDHELSLEVQAAEYAQQSLFLDDYVREGLSSNLPARQARALMVSGFRSNTDAWLPELLPFDSAEGLVGMAYEHARYAFVRNQWAHHWFVVMQQADTAVDYWQASQLFENVVDVRLDVWQREDWHPRKWFQLFEGGLQNPIRRRFDRWKGHREKTLFGLRKPSDSLLGKETAWSVALASQAPQ